MVTKGEETRATIVDEALALSSREGLNGLSIGKLASRLSMSKSGLFAHFGSKEALQAAVIQEIMDLFVRDVIRPAIARPRGLERLDAVFYGWLDWSLQNRFEGGCPLVAVSVELNETQQNLRHQIGEMITLWLKAVAKMATRAVRDGDFRADLDVDQFAFDFNAVGLAFNNSHRLFMVESARERAITSYRNLIERASA